LITLTLWLLAGCGSSTSPPRLDAQTLRDPAACQSCHPSQFEEWSHSMHAQAADDPVFVAMNQRAQRETAGAVGTFCVNCHAPLAVRENLTTDGLNLASLPASKKGVTCYFCHAVESLAGTHDNPLVLATDDSLFGPFGDPAPTTPHAARTSTLFDDTQTDSATMCGSCHDIVNKHGAHVERTFAEWQTTLFSQPQKGLSCQQCHMDGSDGPASTVSTRTRRVHRHDFPAVDLALTAAAATSDLRTRSQELLDATVQSTLCWNSVTSQIEVTLDNVGAGHGWPSGATPDRRAWLEVTAYSGADVTYASGGVAAAPLDASPDPDLWLMRDCLFDGAGAETRMFWQAASLTDNQLPGALTASVTDPASFMGHRQRTFPAAVGAGLPTMPDRITLQVHLQAVGDDVLADLVSSGDLDSSLPPLVARYDVAGAALEWTPATATPQLDARNGLLEKCVFVGRYNANVTPADTHAKCLPPTP
jgi:Cytochrome c554 and c-prime